MKAETRLIVKERYGTTEWGGGVWTERDPTPSEVLAAAATLDGAERMGTFGWMNGQGQPDGHYIEVTRPGRYLVIPLPDKETTDEPL